MKREIASKIACMDDLNHDKGIADLNSIKIAYPRDIYVYTFRWWNANVN